MSDHIRKQTEEFDKKAKARLPTMLTLKEVEKSESLTQTGTFEYVDRFSDTKDVYEELYNHIDGENPEREKEQKLEEHLLGLISFFTTTFKDNPTKVFVILLKLIQPNITTRQMEQYLGEIKIDYSRPQIARFIQEIINNDEFFRFFAAGAKLPPKHALRTTEKGRRAKHPQGQTSIKQQMVSNANPSVS